jgi:CelD/BcsL family acetyltransferase involved in cellulose biosynthesis
MNMPAPLRYEIITDFARLEQFFSQWARLWQSDPYAEVFQTPEWACAWWRAFGHKYEICSAVVFAGDEVVGIVPLVKREGVIHFLGTPEADYADIICQEERTEEVLAVALKALQESVTGWRECVWQHLSKESRIIRHYRALPREILSNLHCLPDHRYQTIVMRDNRDAVFSSLLGKKHTRRRRNKLQKAGEVRFRHLSTQDAAGNHLNDFFRHHIRRHAAVGRRSAYAAPDSRQFIRALLANLDSAVRFGVLELDGQPLAWHLAFEVNGKFLLYQHTFDVDKADYTPGELLLWNLLDYAKDRVPREFDFGSGDESYKQRFANHTRETFRLFIEPVGFKGQTRGLARKAQIRVLPHLLEIQRIAKSNRASLRAFRAMRIRVLKTLDWLRSSEEKTTVDVAPLPEGKFDKSDTGKKCSAGLRHETFDTTEPLIAAVREHSGLRERS